MKFVVSDLKGDLVHPKAKECQNLLSCDAPPLLRVTHWEYRRETWVDLCDIHAVKFIADLMGEMVEP